jgi:hypothetical protein
MAPDISKIDAAYANSHFAMNGPGWESDRGRIYIMYGRPDSIDSDPCGSVDSAKPFEIWHYKQVQEFGPLQQAQGSQLYNANIITRNDLDVKFVDFCACGDYKLQPVPKG